MDGACGVNGPIAMRTEKVFGNASAWKPIPNRMSAKGMGERSVPACQKHYQVQNIYLYSHEINKFYWNNNSFIYSYTEVVTVAGGASTYCLLLLIVVLFCTNGFLYIYMKRQNGPPRDIKTMGSPCYDSYPNQYSSLPTKEDRPKVKRQSSFSAGALNSNGAHIKLLANGHGTLTKTNNMTGHHIPKVLSKSFVEVDTATIKRNSHGLNNARPLRTLDDDKFWYRTV